LFREAALGWFEDDWLFDLRNRYAMFLPDAAGGPMRAMAPMRPMKVTIWSPVSGLAYFSQA
jgi:hypothetical protein